MSIKQCFSNNTREILKYLNEYKQKDNLEFMCAAQAVLQGRRIPLNVCKRNKKFSNQYLSFHLREKRANQTKTKQRKETIKNVAETNETKI